MEQVYFEEGHVEFEELIPLALSSPFTSTPIESRNDRSTFLDLDRAPQKKKFSISRRNLAGSQFGNKTCKRLDFTNIGNNEGRDIKKKSRMLMTALHSNSLALPFSELEKSFLDEENKDEEREAKKPRILNESILTSPAPETPTDDWRFDFSKPTTTPYSNKESFTKLSLGCGRLPSSKNLFDNLNSSPSLLKETLKSKSTARNLNLMLS